MSSSPLVSAVVAAYNSQRFLGETIESILNQTYGPLELIVVDDGSTDGTAEVAKSYPAVRYIHQTNLGPSAARNSGIQAAKGEYLAFSDSDDIWDRRRLQVQMDFHLANPEALVSFTWMRNFLQPGSPRPAWLTPQFEDSYPGLFAGTMVAHRKLFDLVGLFDPEFWHGESAEFFTRIKENGVAINVIEEPLYFRRLHDTNMSLETDKDRRGVIKALKRSLDRKRASDKSS